MEDFGVSFPLLSDPHNEVADRYGLVHGFSEELRDVYREVFGISLPDFNGDDSWTLPMPARYVIDADRRVRWASVSPDYTSRPDPAVTLEALEALPER